MSLRGSVGMLVLVAVGASGCEKSTRAEPEVPVRDDSDLASAHAGDASSRTKAVRLTDCEATAARVESWGAADGRIDFDQPAFDAGAYWALAPVVEPPLAVRGFRYPHEPSLAIGVNASGGVTFPMADTGSPFRYSIAEVPSRVDGFTEMLRKSMRLIVVAEPSVPAGFLQRLRKEVPGDVEIGVAVRMPADAVVEPWMRRFPKARPEVRRALVAALSKTEGRQILSLLHLGRAFEAASGNCRVRQTVAKNLLQGGGISRIGPATADELRRCRCEGADLSTVELLVAFTSILGAECGWVPVWSPDDARWTTLPSTATVKDLVARLDP